MALAALTLADRLSLAQVILRRPGTAGSPILSQAYGPTCQPILTGPDLRAPIGGRADGPRPRHGGPGQDLEVRAFRVLRLRHLDLFRCIGHQRARPPRPPDCQIARAARRSPWLLDWHRGEGGGTPPGRSEADARMAVVADSPRAWAEMPGPSQAKVSPRDGPRGAAKRPDRAGPWAGRGGDRGTMHGRIVQDLRRVQHHHVRRAEDDGLRGPVAPVAGGKWIFPC